MPGKPSLSYVKVQLQVDFLACNANRVSNEAACTVHARLSQGRQHSGLVGRQQPEDEPLVYPKLSLSCIAMKLKASCSQHEMQAPP